MQAHMFYIPPEQPYIHLYTDLVYISAMTVLTQLWWKMSPFLQFSVDDDFPDNETKGMGNAASNCRRT